LLPIRSILPPLPRFRIVDVGASGTGDPPAYANLVNAVACDIVGFEPIAAECEKLMRHAKPGHLYLPYAIGDGSVRTFYECSSPFCSSLYEPDIALAEKFQYLAEYMNVVKTDSVQTKRLDDIPETEGTDFLKVDVQGGELLVFEGAVQRLKNVLVVHTEVEFVAMYKNQPLFAEVDSFLRAHGFCFHKMEQWGRTFKPVVMKDDPGARLSQSLWADAVYVRDFMRFDDLAPGALLKLAAILHEIDRSYDLAAFALQAYDSKMKTRLQMTYLEGMMAG
jgi:FkbM family methyltransferase